jgi:alpha-tubulin suppressor-like RCC1 family protein
MRRCVALLLLQASCGQPGFGDSSTGGESGSEPTSSLDIWMSFEEPPREWRHVSAGWRHTCAIALDGSLWCWGTNSHLQVGIPGKLAVLGTLVPRPTRITELSDWESVSSGQLMTCALRGGGRIWCWGSNVPTLREPVEIVDGKWSSLSTGAEHWCAIAQGGVTWCYGANEQGQLGLGVASPPVRQAFPIVGEPFVARRVDGGSIRSYAIDVDGHLWSWGGAYTAGTIYWAATPEVRGGDSDWDDVDCDKFHTCALKTDDRLFCGGDNFGGALGIGDASISSAPFSAVVGELRWSTFDLGTSFTCALTLDGVLYCWGTNDHGQLGAGDKENRPAPTIVRHSRPWLEISAGATHTCGIDAAHELWCWGDNSSFQLGLPDFEAPDEPRSVTSN